ncbi:FecR family protein [Arenimonas alkanexedens]
MLRNALLIAALSATPALAAEPAAILSTQEGTVLVNQGDEFVTATENQALVAGDRVLVMEGARAEITFTDGCVLPLPEGSMLDLPAVSTCAGATAQLQKIGPSLAQAEESAENAEPKATGVNPYLIGAGAVLVVAALMQSGGGNDRPASP